MRFFLLATFVTISAVCADPSSSFLIEANFVNSFVQQNESGHLSDVSLRSSCQVKALVSNDMHVQASSEMRDRIAGSATYQESWWAYSKRLAFGAVDAAYQLYRSNRFTGVESGSCQSWTALTKLDDLKHNWNVHANRKALVHNNGTSAISIQRSDTVISKGYELFGLQDALSVAKKLQKETKVSNVYVPLNLYLTNHVTGACIMHRVTLETQYDKEGSLRSVKILDPQTALSGVYLSDASALCEAAFTELKKTESRVATEYIAAGIQLPMTGNCQKMAAYIAVVLGEGTSIEELTLKEANAFCTKLHNTDTATSKSTKWLGGWLPKLW